MTAINAESNTTGNRDDSFLNKIKYMLVAEIKKVTTIIEDNHVSLTKQIDSVKNEIYEKYDAIIGEIEKAIIKLENKAVDVGDTASHSYDMAITNTNDILTIKMDIMNLKKCNKDIKEKLDDNINISMQSNLVFFNVPEQKEETYESTKQIVSKLLVDNLNWDPQTAHNSIIRAHRSGKRINQKARPIFTKFTRDDVADSIDYGFISVDRRGATNQIRCSKQYTPDVQARRKKALSVRYDLKQITKTYIDYPAKLLVMLPGAEKYTLHSIY